MHNNYALTQSYVFITLNRPNRKPLNMRAAETNPTHCNYENLRPNPTQPMDSPNPWPCLLWPSWAPLPPWMYFASVWPLFHLYRTFHYHMEPFHLREAPERGFRGGLRRLCNRLAKIKATQTKITATDTYNTNHSD